MHIALPRGSDRVSGADLAQRLRSVADDLPAGSERWKVAMVVLSVAHVPFNVDRLSGAAGVPRELAAKVVRRLFDNGISPHDVPDPVDAPWQEDTFWQVVGVAEGSLLRRAEDGWVEWVSAGCGARATGADVYDPDEEPRALAGALPELFPGARWLT
jgi:hypothetical protein